MKRSKVKGAAAPRDTLRANPLLPHGTPTAAEVDEFLDVVAFCFSRAMVSPALLRLMALGEEARKAFGQA